MTKTNEHELDAKGLICPEPVMLLHKKVRDMAAGECVRVRATDPSTQRDIPNFCEFLGHQLVSSEADNGEFVYVIRKST